AFIKNNGVRGSQLRFLTPGPYKIHPLLFNVTPVGRTVVPEGMVGLVSAADGEPLEKGQLLGKHVSGHNNFQNAETFLKNKGQKGPQVDFLRPGTYNIHTGMFTVQIVKATVIPQGSIGIVEAKDGKPMGNDDVVAKTPEMALHESFQDGQKFLDNNGF